MFAGVRGAVLLIKLASIREHTSDACRKDRARLEKLSRIIQRGKEKKFFFNLSSASHAQMVRSQCCLNMAHKANDAFSCGWIDCMMT